MNVSFEVSKRDSKLISEIVHRARAMGLCEDRLEAEMDITAAHANGCPIDLRKLLASDAATFGHDVGGISRYIDRKTGALTGFFVPRCAKECS